MVVKPAGPRTIADSRRITSRKTTSKSGNFVWTQKTVAWYDYRQLDRPILSTDFSTPTFLISADKFKCYITMA